MLALLCFNYHFSFLPFRKLFFLFYIFFCKSQNIFQCSRHKIIAQVKVNNKWIWIIRVLDWRNIYRERERNPSSIKHVLCVVFGGWMLYFFECGDWKKIKIIYIINNTYPYRSLFFFYSSHLHTFIAPISLFYQ